MTNAWLDPGSHAVRFYENDAAAYDSIADFFTAGANAGDPLVLVARPSTFKAVAGLLASGRYGPPVAAGRIHFGDVDSALAQVMDAGALDPARCKAFLAQLLADVRRDHAGGTIRFFGEGAGVLCERGLFGDALALEGIVGGLSRIEPRLAVFCGYSLTRFRDGTNARQYRVVCDQYGHAGFAEGIGESPPRDEEPPPQTSQNPPAPPVYVIDDDASIRRSLGRFLNLTPWPVRTFDSGEAFLAELDHLPPGCLVIDIQLGGMSGLDLLEHMRTARPAWPAIAMSGSDDDRATNEALRLGARAFLRKPFDAQSLRDAIALALA